MAYRLTREYLASAIENKKTAEDIAREVGCAKSTVYNNLRKFGLEIPDAIVEGETEFGSLRVLRMLSKTGKDTFYECECVCGTIKPVRRSNLVTGSATTCGCSFRRRGAAHPLFRGHGDISAKYWKSLIAGAAFRSLKFAVTIEEAWQIFLEQQKRCKLTGMRLKFGSRRVHTASLDRINSKRGYVPGNIQWVHKDINRMKLNFSEPYFIKLCCLVAEQNA